MPNTFHFQGDDNPPVTPSELLDRAEKLALRLLGLDEATRVLELRGLKANNPTMHALVKDQMEGMRRASQGQ